MLRSIVYVSSSIRPMSEPDLESLLLEARRLNQETETTGVLLYGGGTFMQCFEGPDDLVSITYERIRASTRHKGIIELVDEPVQTRSFDSWLMGFKRAQKSEILLFTTVEWRRLERTSAADSAGMELLRTFWHNTLD